MRIIVLLGMLMLSESGITAAEVSRKFEPRYQAIYQTAKTNWQANVTNTGRAWEFARATFDLAEFATNDTQRAQIANEGIDAARAAILIDEKCAPAHYYLAMNLGQRARTEFLGALRLVTEMEKHFNTVASLEPTFDYAGADRNLGILFREAPGWPASIGNRSKARAHLKKAVELSPAYPANRLELLECYVDWKEVAEAERILASVEKCLAGARMQFKGEAWAWSWEDWEQMWDTLRKRLEKLGN